MFQTNGGFRMLAGSVRAGTAAGVEVPQPAPDVVDLPPSPHPVPTPPPRPPEINDPIQPGQNVPIRDPMVPTQLS